MEEQEFSKVLEEIDNYKSQKKCVSCGVKDNLHGDTAFCHRCFQNTLTFAHQYQSIDGISSGLSRLYPDLHGPTTQKHEPIEITRGVGPKTEPQMNFNIK